MVEAPLLIKTLPEGWALPSVIGAVAQFGQIGPIILYFIKCQMFSCCPGRFLVIKKKRVSDRIIIYTLFAIGIVAMAATALFWDKTSWIFEKKRSMPFLTCVFFLAILDCTCTIVFLTYIGKFKQNYVTALYIGEGISSLLPGILALAQGIGEENDCHKEINSSYINSTQPLLISNSIQPNFSVSFYFWILFIIILISFAAFVALDKLPTFRNHKIKRNKNIEINETQDEEALKGEDAAKEKIVGKPKNERGKYYLYIAITIVSFLLYGFIPGLSSYSALPYSSKTMHLCISLGYVQNLTFR